MIKTDIRVGLSLFVAISLTVEVAHANKTPSEAKPTTLAVSPPNRLEQPASVDPAGVVSVLPRRPSTKNPIVILPRVAVVTKPPTSRNTSDSRKRLGNLLGQLQSANNIESTAEGRRSSNVLLRSLKTSEAENRANGATDVANLNLNPVARHSEAASKSESTSDTDDGRKSDLNLNDAANAGTPIDSYDHDPPKTKLKSDDADNVELTLDVKLPHDKLPLDDPVLRHPTEPLVLTPAVESLKRPIHRCLAIYDHQYLNTREHACWSTMHLLLAHGEHSRIHMGGHGAKTTSTLDWLCNNNPCAGRQVYYVDGDIIRGRVGPGFQGHPGQLLAIFAQIQVPVSKSLVVDGRQFTIADLVRSEQLTCKEGTELTFKLIGLLQYLPSDATWTSEDGTEWDFPKLIKAELAEDINGAACGGTHRIMAISHAALKRRYRGESIEGEWWRAEKFMLDYQRYVYSLQNEDGSISSEWFKGRSNRGDRDRQLQTTGHILEWWIHSLPDKDLSDPRLLRSIAFLTNLMIANRYHDWEKGPKGHAIRALNLYYQRAFGYRQIANEPRVYPRPRSTPENNSVFSRLRNRFK